MFPLTSQHKRKRKPDNNDLQTPSLAMKKGRYKFQRKFKSNFFQYDNIDQAIASDLFKTLKSCIKSDIVENEIIQLITEYSIGWIKLCECGNGEVLIIPSSFENPEIPLKFSHCKCKLFIHFCDNCDKGKNNVIWIYMKMHFKFPWRTHYNSWWIYHKPISETHGTKEPRNNACIECFEDDEHWYDRSELCLKCTFKCSGCGNTFCRQNHINYLCSDCNTYYCRLCKIWNDETIHTKFWWLSMSNKACINCIFNLNSYCAYYSNLKDRYRFYTKITALQKTQLVINNNIPTKIIHLIGQYANGFIIKCTANNKCVGTISFLVEDITYFIEQQFQCQFGHINYIHHCDLCKFQFWFSSVSKIQYLSVHHQSHISNYYSHYGDIHVNSKQQLMIQQSICSECIDSLSTLTKLCENCSFQCYRCDRVLCNKHFGTECILCGAIYCELDDDEFKWCTLCGHYACPECQMYYSSNCNDLSEPWVDCYDLYQVCDRCYSPQIGKYYPAPHQYKSCLNIVETIADLNTPLTIFECWEAINLIAVYVKMML